MIRDRLRALHLVRIVQRTSDGAVMRVRRHSTPEAQHREIYDLLDIHPDHVPVGKM
jgi:hypothetical protein